MVAADLVPEAVRVTPAWRVGLVGSLAAGAMIALQAALL